MCNLYKKTWFYLIYLVYAKSEEDCDELTEMKEPCTVLNADGEILVWYIPDCLVQERLVRIVSLTNGLQNHYLICIKESALQFRKRCPKQLAAANEKKGRFQE